MASLVWRVRARQLAPLRASLQYPQNPIEDLSRVSSWTALAILSRLGFRKKRLDEGPLGVGEFHGQGRSENRLDVDPPAIFDLLSRSYASGVFEMSSIVPCSAFLIALNNQDSLQLSATVAQAICISTLLGPVIGTMLFVGGIVLDRVRVAMFDSDKKESVAYEYSKKAQAAYDKKMEAIQKMPESTPNSQPPQTAPASSSPNVELEENVQSY